MACTEPLAAMMPQLIESLRTRVSGEEPLRVVAAHEHRPPERHAMYMPKRAEIMRTAAQGFLRTRNRTLS